MDDWEESELAWELADAVNPLLAGNDLAQLYAIIGSGESYTAITTVLPIAVRHGLPMPTELIIKLTEWFGAYAHSDDAPRLRELLDAISSVR